MKKRLKRDRGMWRQLSEVLSSITWKKVTKDFILAKFPYPNYKRCVFNQSFPHVTHSKAPKDPTGDSLILHSVFLNAKTFFSISP